jgi:hypothetical protein
MTKQEDAERAIKLARKCQDYVAVTSQEWRTQVPDDPTDWESFREVGELFLSLDTLDAKANLLCQRAITMGEWWYHVGE